MTSVVLACAVVVSVVAETERFLSAENPHNCIHYAKPINNPSMPTPRADARSKVRATDLCCLLTPGKRKKS